MLALAYHGAARPVGVEGASSGAWSSSRSATATSIAGNAQAQIRKLFAERASKIEGFASTLIPKPALLRKRLEMTGKDITLGKYAMVCLGLIAFVDGRC